MLQHSRRFRVGFVFTVTGLALFGPASRCLADATNGPTQLNPVVVTASRYAQTADSALASVSVITRKDIRREQPQDVLQALQSLPGVEITRSGGYGKVSSVFLRGTDSNQVLVLVNGVRVGSAANGAAPWEYIPINQIQRIEVVRGPRSSLYGADAVGGVIQIFTRKGPWHGDKASVSLMGGSYGTGRGNAAFGWGNGRTRGNLDVGIFHTDGFNARTTPGPYAEPDRDGYANRNFNIALSHRFRQSDFLSLSYMWAQGYSQYDPNPSFGGNDLEHFIDGVFSAKYRVAVTDNDSLRLQAGRSRDQRTDRRQDHTGTPTRFNTTQPSVSLINQYAFGRTTWLVGGDYRDERLSSTTAYTKSSRYNRGAFTEITSRYLGIDGQVSGRFDNNEAYGDHLTGQIGLGYDITRTYRVEASYGNAFQAPSFNYLYYPGYANPDLKPESSRSAELDFLGRYGWGGWRMNLYQTKISDMIVSRAPDFIPRNVQHARIRGVELQTHAQIGATRIKASTGYIQAINRDTGNDLARRPRWTGSLAVDHRFGALSAGARVGADGPRYDNPANTVRLSGFALVSLHATYRLTSHWRIQASVDNLLDRHYHTVAGYRSPGRAGYLTVTWHTRQD